jgi:transposase
LGTSFQVHQGFSGPDIELHSCYEAGLFGYHLHRTLQEMGVTNIVVTPERLDSYNKGNTAAFSRVRVPTPEQEMDRLVSRQRWSHLKEKQCRFKRARSLMLTHGISAPDEWLESASWKILQEHLPAPLAAQVGYWRDIAMEIQKGHDALSEELRKDGERRRRPKGFGALSMEELSREILDWNRFKNRREVSSYTGLCPSEYSSGQSRSQGSVTKHGNSRVATFLLKASGGFCDGSLTTSLSKPCTQPQAKAPARSASWPPLDNLPWISGGFQQVDALASS